MINIDLKRIEIIPLGTVSSDEGGSANADLTNYYTKGEVNTKLQTYSKTSHTHTEYLTEDALNENYYNKGEVDSKIPTDYITGNDLGKYITEDELNDMNFATKLELPSEYDDTSIVNRITALETELTGVSEQITELNNMVV